MGSIGGTTSAYVQKAFTSAIKSSGINHSRVPLSTAASTGPNDTTRLPSLA